MIQMSIGALDRQILYFSTISGPFARHQASSSLASFLPAWYHSERGGQPSRASCSATNISNAEMKSEGWSRVTPKSSQSRVSRTVWYAPPPIRLHEGAVGRCLILLSQNLC